MNIEVKIKKALNNVKAWQRVPTSLEGIFLVKTPNKSGKETILVEINPKDENGNLMKRRGLFIKTNFELEKFNHVMASEKLKEVLMALENISGPMKEKNIETIDI